jgi:hypothetical protein
MLAGFLLRGRIKNERDCGIITLGGSIMIGFSCSCPFFCCKVYITLAADIGLHLCTDTAIP